MSLNLFLLFSLPFFTSFDDFITYGLNFYQYLMFKLFKRFYYSNNYSFKCLYHSLFDKKSKEEESILSDGLQADVSLYLLHKRTYHATRRKSFTLLPGMQSPYKNDGRYNDEGLKFDFPRLRIVKERHIGITADPSTVPSGLEGKNMPEDGEGRYVSLLDKKSLKPVVVAPVGRGLWLKAQNKMRHQRGDADEISLNSVKSFRKRRKNPRQNHPLKRGSVVSVMSIGHYGSVKRRYSISSTDNTISTLVKVESVRSMFSLEERTPPQMVRSSYIPTGRIDSQHTYCYVLRIISLQ